MKRGDGKIEGEMWALAALWAALLAGAPFLLAGVRRKLESMGCFAIGREATVPFSFTPRLGDGAMALPWPTGFAFAVPLAVWLILAAIVPPLLIWKTRRLPCGAAEVVDILAAVGLVATFGLLIAACVIPQ